MPTFYEWLERVLSLGESVLENPLRIAVEERPALLTMLQQAYRRHTLDIAGPPIPFAADTGIWAANLLAWACWRLVGGTEDEGESPDLNREPESASEHLSGDLTLRFLPAVHARARSLPGGDKLTASLELVFRTWPLTGVLADLESEPATSLEFANHLGLQMLYAERQVVTGRPGWVPDGGLAREWIERIYAERKKLMPSPRSALVENAHD